MPLKDVQYLKIHHQKSEKKHVYGSHVHLLEDPFHQTLLAKFCSSEVVQPQANTLIKTLYHFLLTSAVNTLFQRSQKEIKTRMYPTHPEAFFKQNLLAGTEKIVIVDLMRAGILPSQICFEVLHEIYHHAHIRLDHILLNRKINKKNEVIGAHIHGTKIGGSIQHTYVFLPDPMGATGHSLTSVLDLYRSQKRGQPKKFVALHLIVTPEYLKKVKTFFPLLEIFALRLDRGLSQKPILSSPLGRKWNEERGLNDKDYIVPGAGGIGEILSNSFV